MSVSSYQQRGTSQGSNLDGSEARGVCCGGHSLDTAQEDLHVLLAGGLALASDIINILSSTLSSLLTPHSPHRRMSWLPSLPSSCHRTLGAADIASVPLKFYQNVN